MSETLDGIIPIIATPFHPDGSLDLDSQARLVDHLLNEGSHGLALFGNAGEGYTLLPDERVTLLDLIAKRAAGRTPIVVGAADHPTTCEPRVPQPICRCYARTF